MKQNSLKSHGLEMFFIFFLSRQISIKVLFYLQWKQFSSIPFDYLRLLKAIVWLIRLIGWYASCLQLKHKFTFQMGFKPIKIVVYKQMRIGSAPSGSPIGKKQQTSQSRIIFMLQLSVEE